MKKQILLLCLFLATGLTGIAQQSTLTRKLVNGKYGFGYPSLTRKDGNGYPLVEALTIPAIYDETSNVTFVEEYENLVGVKKDGKWGYIDPTGATKIPFKYDEAGYFHEGLAPVIIGGKCGFINKSGTLVIPLKYDYATSFTDGVAYVELGGKIGFINKTGVAIVPIKYDKQTNETYKKCYHCGGDLNSFKDGKAVVALAGKCGVVDAKGIFTECKDEALETITYKGVAKKDVPSVFIKGSCQTNQDVKTVRINGKEHNDIQIGFTGQEMFCSMSGIKKGDKVTIEIVHVPGCTYKLKPNDALQLDPGQDNLIYKPEAIAEKIPEGCDSTKFSLNPHVTFELISSGSYPIKKLRLNDMFLHLYPGPGSTDSEEHFVISTDTYFAQASKDLNLTVWHLKGTKVKMVLKGK